MAQGSPGRLHTVGYIQWAITHNSLLILTWDEDDGSATSHIATIFVGAHVKAGHYSESMNHYSVESVPKKRCQILTNVYICSIFLL